MQWGNRSACRYALKSHPRTAPHRTLSLLCSQVAFSDITVEDLSTTRVSDISVKLIRLSQLTIEYLLYVQASHENRDGYFFWLGEGDLEEKEGGGGDIPRTSYSVLSISQGLSTSP